METVNNLATQASKMLFGGNEYDAAAQSGQEPRSGETGDVRRGEPYDAGNKDEPDVDNTGTIKSSTAEGFDNNDNNYSYSNSNSNSNIRNTTNYNTSDNMSGDLKDNRKQNDYGSGNLDSINKSSTSRDQYGSTQSPSGDFRSDDVASGTRGQKSLDPTTTTSNTTPGNVTTAEDSQGDNYANKINAQPSAGRSANRVPDNNPPSNAADNAGDRIVGDPSSGGNQAKQKQQGADRPTEQPTGREHEAVRDTKRNAEAAANDDASGPGPGSSAQKTGSGGSGAGAGPGAGPGASGGGPMGGDGEKPESKSHGEGTGEKYVKSTGMKADGGDFDAAKPGAGREADRLLEEKGIHREEEANANEGKNKKDGSPSPDRQGSEKGSKKGFTEKIKQKLHKH